MRKLIKNRVIKILSWALIVALCLSACGGSGNSVDAQRIANELLTRLNDSRLRIEVYNQDNDPNGILGKEFAYTSKANIYEADSSDADFYLSVEVFANAKDAEIRNLLIVEGEKLWDSQFSAEKFGTAEVVGALFAYKSLQGNVYLRGNRKLSEQQFSQIVTYLPDFIKDYDFPQ